MRDHFFLSYSWLMDLLEFKNKSYLLFNHIVAFCHLQCDDHNSTLSNCNMHYLQLRNAYYILCSQLLWCFECFFFADDQLESN